MKKLDLSPGSALVVVAHPDDETIWMGGTILSNPNIHWTVFSLCRGDDADRAPKFRKVCALLGAQPIMSDLEDEWIMSLDESIPEIEKRLLNLLPLKTYNTIFTHALNGEYGHIRHIGVHKAMEKLLAEGALNADVIYNFSYHRKSGDRIARPDAPSQCGAKFSTDILKIKKDLIHIYYGFGKKSFEYISAGAVETFNPAAAGGNYNSNLMQHYENTHALRAS